MAETKEQWELEPNPIVFVVRPDPERLVAWYRHSDVARTLLTRTNAPLSSKGLPTVPDLLTSQLRQLAFAVVTGQLRLTPVQRDAVADLNAAAAVVDRADAEALTPPNVGVRLWLVPATKEPA